MKRAVLFLLCLLSVSSAWADWVVFRIPGSRRGSSFLLPARSTKVLPGGIVAVQHEVGNLYLKLSDCEIKRRPSVSEQYEKLERQALSKKDAAEMMNVARWALQRGMLKQFNLAVDQSLKFDANHADAKRVVALRDKLSQPIKDVSKPREEMQQLVRTTGMKFKSSNHYLLMYNTSEKPDEGRRKARHDERIDLLEKVYETFMYKFYAQGVDLEIPKQPLKVVLFNNVNEYNALSGKFGGDLYLTAGFYEHTTNTAFFYDQGTHESFKELLDLDKDLQNVKKDALRSKASNRGDIVRLADSIHLLVFLERESQDVEVVSHECTHQIAANTGLLPKHVMIPSWVHEGLATYFESPKDASWAGFGAVNEQRLEFYNKFAKIREISNLDFVVSNQVFDYARSHGAILNGYAQAWAMTHFLMEKHFEKFVAYYRKLGEMPPDVPLSAEVLVKLFAEVFGENREGLEAEWKAYMRGLKTEKQLALED